MSNNRVTAITAWMKHNRSHLNWDLTFATRPEPINDLVALAHCSHEDSALGDIEGEIELSNSDVTHILTGYRMGPPLLAGLQASYASPKVQQRIALEGGSHLIMDKTEGLLGLSLHDLLDPLPVTQSLLLTADAQGVSADLREGTDTELHLSDGSLQRREAGRFFKDLLSNMGSARQVYPLISFEQLSGNPYLRVRRSEVRVHASKATGELALVVFAGVDHGSSGDFPGEGANYPFLLPDDLEQPVTSAVLLTSPLLHRAAYATGFEHMLKDGAFVAHYDTDNNLQRLDAKSGHLQVHPSDYQTDKHEFSCDPFQVAVGAAQPLQAESHGLLGAQHGQACCCSCCAVDLASEPGQPIVADFQSPLSATFEHDQVRQQWQSSCLVTLRYKVKPSGAWRTYPATFKFNLQTVFNLNEPASPEESAGCMLLGQVLWPWQQAAEVTPVSGLPNDMSPALRQEICAFVAFLLKQAVLEGLAKQLTAMIPEQVMDGIALAGDQHLAPLHNVLPDGMALFASGYGTAGMRMVDSPVLLTPGQLYPFTVEPARGGLVWSVESLPGMVGDLGRIGRENGEYRAPPVHAMEGKPVRVRIVATDPRTRERCTTMATVALGTLTVNPLIRVCYCDDTLTLTAGTLSGDLAWSVIGAGEEGRGWVRPDSDGRRCTYTAGSQLEGPETYLLDQVQVHNIQTGEQRTVYVLVRQRRPQLQIEVEQLPGGELQLHGWAAGALRSDTQWTLPIEGTGQIDKETGRYSPGSADPDARFTLITAKWEMMGFNFEGHLILPLPLSLHFEATRRAASPAGLRVAQSPSLGG